MEASCPIKTYSCCCYAARAAHTLNATKTLDYWPALAAMVCCPFCTIFYARSFTDMNVKLGGHEKDCLTGCLCSFFCGCCSIAQDAESLDLATGVKTSWTDAVPVVTAAVVGNDTVVDKDLGV